MSTFGVYERVDVEDDEDNIIRLLDSVFRSIQGYKVQSPMEKRSFLKLAKISGMLTKHYKKLDYDMLWTRILKKSKFQ